MIEEMQDGVLVVSQEGSSGSTTPGRVDARFARSGRCALCGIFRSAGNEICRVAIGAVGELEPFRVDASGLTLRAVACRRKAVSVMFSFFSKTWGGF